MDTRMMRRAGVIGVGLLLASSVGASAQQTVGGFTWEPFQVSDTTDIGVAGVIPLPDGGFGMHGERFDEVADGLAIWMSADDGLTWTETVLKNDDPDWAPLYDFHGRYEGEETFDVAANGDELVAVRTVPGKTRRTFILTSPDGEEWTIADRLKNVHVEDIMSTPDGLVMHGLDFREAKGFGKRLGGYPTLWTSDDGAEWEAHEITKPFYKPKDTEYEVLDRIVRSDDGTWMAAGLHAEFPEKGEPIIVHTILTAGADLEWTEVTRPIINEGRRDVWFLLDSTPAGFLFHGRFLDVPAGVGEGGLWLTPDGAAWEQVWEHDMIATLAPGTPELAVNTASGVIGWAPPFVWTDLSLEDRKDGADMPTYTSSDGRTWKHDPATDVLAGIWVDGAYATPDGRVIVEGRDTTGCLDSDVECAGVLLIGTPG